MATVGEMVDKQKARHNVYSPIDLSTADTLRELGIWDAEVLEGCAWHNEVKFTGRMLCVDEAGQRVRVIVLPCKEE